jgi:hypothetical protein
MMLAGSRCARSLAGIIFALIVGAGDCIADDPGDPNDRSKFFASAGDRAEPGLAWRYCCQIGKISERQAHESPALQAWRLVRTPSPTGGANSVAIMRAADAVQSDIDLAGLMVRCGSQDPEVLVVVVRPFPPRAHPTVRIGPPGEVISFTATVVPPGAAVLLPAEAGRIAYEKWQFASQLVIEVTDDQSLIRGMVSTGQMGPALGALMVACSMK